MQNLSTTCLAHVWNRSLADPIKRIQVHRTDQLIVLFRNIFNLFASVCASAVDYNVKPSKELCSLPYEVLCGRSLAIKRKANSVGFSTRRTKHLQRLINLRLV